MVCLKVSDKIGRILVTRRYLGGVSWRWQFGTKKMRFMQKLTFFNMDDVKYILGILKRDKWKEDSGAIETVYINTRKGERKL